MRKRSLASLANEAVPFTLAAAWVGLSGGRNKHHCPFGLGHDDGGDEPAFRVYEDHGYCFSCRRRFSVVALLAGVWEADPEDAAAEALRRVGYKPATYAHLWEQASLAVAPDTDALAAALKTWCSAHCADWETRQYSEAVAVRLARCLGLLHLVKDAPDCERWLDGCKRAMQPYLS